MENFEEDLSFKFDEPMDECDGTKNETLKLVNIDLKLIKDNFTVSDDIKSINLENNKIVYISPNAFNAVPNLSCLNIRHNYLKNVFDSFLVSFNYTSLKKLNMADVVLKKTSDDSHSPDISISNEDNAIYSNSRLPYLTHLDISNNNIKELPKYFSSMFPSLTHLYLSDNDLISIDYLPRTMQYLYLERNHRDFDLFYVPTFIPMLFLNDNTFIGKFNKYPILNTLSMRNCKNVLQVIENFHKESLVNLDMSSNKIHSIHVKLFINAASLKKLSLDRNNIDSLSFLVPLHSLTDLSVAYNNLGYLTSYSLLPLVSLRNLNFRGNNIVAISVDTFSRLRKLEKLDLSENNLKMLPEFWMRSVTSLNYLNLKSNFFLNVDNMHISRDSNVNHLLIGDNSFIKIDIKSLSNLPTNVNVHFSSKNCSTSIL
ncbi:hypothetical protein M0802_002788 [Mischocyttarus mexicanus]|nr:hypothetical protein M0802_002788 [Mischocyttarus mexicanus]